MKKLTLLAILLFVFSGSIFAQQILWATSSADGSVRVIPGHNVKNEILKFCDQYAYYLNLTGYSKGEFVSQFGDRTGSFDWVYTVDYAVVAVRGVVELLNIIHLFMFLS